MIIKKKIRCYKTFARVAPNVYNHLVYFLPYEGWSNFSLTTCINCGELFVIDWENPATQGLSIKQIASSNICPTCGCILSNTIQEYPKTIKLSNGQLGSFIPETHMPPDNESLINEFFEIIP